MSHIRVQPIAGAMPLECVLNVEKCIRACGGKKVYGWASTRRTRSPSTDTAIAFGSLHGELVDVTPVFTGVQEEFVTVEWPEHTWFERDDTVAENVKQVKYLPKL